MKRSLLLWLHNKSITPFAAKSEMVWYFIGVYMINRTLHGCLKIWNFSSPRNNILYLCQGLRFFFVPHLWLLTLLILAVHRMHVLNEPSTVEPRFNKVPRDWGNWFVILRIHYIENLDLTNLRGNNQNVRYIEVWLMFFFFFFFFLRCYVARERERAMCTTTYSFWSCIRGYHTYKDIWDAIVGEVLDCKVSTLRP